MRINVVVTGDNTLILNQNPQHHFAYSRYPSTRQHFQLLGVGYLIDDDTFFSSMCDAMMTYIQVRDIIFQRLIYEDSPYTQLVWLIGELGSIPMGAIIGSHTQDGAPLYVISVEGIPGCYDARNQFVEYEEYGAQQTTEFKYLALVFGMYTPVSLVL